MKAIKIGHRWLKTDLSGKGVYITDTLEWNALTIVVYIKDDGKMCARDEESFRKKYAPKFHSGHEVEPEDVALAIADNDF